MILKHLIEKQNLAVGTDLNRHMRSSGRITYMWFPQWRVISWPAQRLSASQGGLPQESCFAVRLMAENCKWVKQTGHLSSKIRLEWYHIQTACTIRNESCPSARLWQLDIFIILVFCLNFISIARYLKYELQTLVHTRFGDWLPSLSDAIQKGKNWMTVCMYLHTFCLLCFLMKISCVYELFLYVMPKYERASSPKCYYLLEFCILNHRQWSNSKLQAQHKITEQMKTCLVNTLPHAALSQVKNNNSSAFELLEDGKTFDAIRVCRKNQHISTSRWVSCG